MGDSAQLGLHAGAYYHSVSTAAEHSTPREDRVMRLQPGSAVTELWMGGLMHGTGLSRQCRLVHPEVDSLHKPGVRGRTVSLSKDNEVASDERLSGNRSEEHTSE